MYVHATASQWATDLDYLVEALQREHRNLFHSVSAQRFDTAVRALRARLPTLAGYETVVELARLVALVGDGHTRLPLTEVPGFRRYPLRLYHYADGLFVQSSAREYAGAAGGRLLAIGATPAIDAYDAMRPLISRDNEMGIRATAPALLTIPEVLQVCGVIDDPDHASFLVQCLGGEHLACTKSPCDATPVDVADARDGAAAATPLWLQRSPDDNWYAYLAESRALYVQYNRVRDSQDESLAAFFDRIFTLVDREAVERLILDIRLNHGGNMVLNRPLIHQLIRCDRLNHWGRLFAIIGRHTFSAAMNLAVDLERHTQALFVGEPTGASPNHYGENAEIILPHSGLRCTASALWWQYADPQDDRPWIAPDIPAPLWSADYRANRDPALDAALRYVPDVASGTCDRRAPSPLAWRPRPVRRSVPGTAMQEYLERDRWQLADIEAGLAELAAGDLATPEEVEATFARLTPPRLPLTNAMETCSTTGGH